MVAYGVRFCNRARRQDDDCPAWADVEFLKFAAICDSLGVAKYVQNVEYSTNTNFYDIDVSDDVHEGGYIAGGIEWAADQSLRQFYLFGRVEHKGGLDSECQ